MREDLNYFCEDNSEGYPIDCEECEDCEGSKTGLNNQEPLDVPKPDPIPPISPISPISNLMGDGLHSVHSVHNQQVDLHSSLHGSLHNSGQAVDPDDDWGTF